MAHRFHLASRRRRLPGQADRRQRVPREDARPDGLINGAGDASCAPRMARWRWLPRVCGTPVRPPWSCRGQPLCRCEPPFRPRTGRPQPARPGAGVAGTDRAILPPTSAQAWSARASSSCERRGHTRIASTSLPPHPECPRVRPSSRQSLVDATRKGGSIGRVDTRPIAEDTRS